MASVFGVQALVADEFEWPATDSKDRPWVLQFKEYYLLIVGR